MLFNKARNAFLSEVVSQINCGEDIVIVSADLASPVLDKLREEHPERFVPVGIAEQNLISIGSGIALEGSKVICYTQAPFIVTRAYDQIRNSVALMKIPMCIVGVGVGFNTPQYGATHYVTEDVALIRTCPGINILNVADEALGNAVGKRMCDFKSPTYIRLDKDNYEAPVSGEIDLAKGFRVFHHGSRLAIISSGFLGLKLFNENSNEIQEKSIMYLDIFSYQYDKEQLAKTLTGVSKVVVIEETIEMGSLYQDIKSQFDNMEVSGIHVKFDEFPNYYGDRNYFLEKFGLTWGNVLTKL